MSDNPDYPQLHPETSAKLANARDTVVSNAQSAYNTVANHPVTQSVTQGPVADKARQEADKTSNEFTNVVNSKKTPEQPAATGQPLTHYHSLFYTILSWENPRVTTISYASTIVFIFFTRYVPVLKYLLKGTYVVLGITAAAEVAGKLIFDRGFSSQLRPRKYYTIPKESLENSVGDLEQFLNFFVIEFQRIVFAENIYATVGAFTSALISYFLVKFVPKWGIALIATSIIYLVPLVYIKNRQVIDGQLENAGNIINQQASQVRDLTAQHAGTLSETIQNTVHEYSAKAQEYLGHAKKEAESEAHSVSQSVPQSEAPAEREYTKDDLPSAPSSEPILESTKIEPIAQ